jgi:hypothetical protein
MTMTKQVTGTVTFGARTPINGQDDWRRQANGWTVELRYDGRKMTVDYWTGMLVQGPTIDDVMLSLCLDVYEGSFEDWASDYGYDEDSRSAERTYEAVMTQTANLRRLLGDDFESVHMAYLERHQ